MKNPAWTNSPTFLCTKGQVKLYPYIKRGGGRKDFSHADGGGGQKKF